MTAPVATARFRPRADLDTLQALKRQAREAFAAELNAEVAASDVAETITAWLEARYPADDMAVLARHGCARETTALNVSAKGHYFGVSFTRALLLPDRVGPLTACARRFSEEDGYGLKPDYLAQLTAKGGLEAYLADHREREAGWLPKSVDPIFIALATARDDFARIERELDAFATTKGPTGEYPLWSEIEAAFPVLGAYVAGRRS